jgi:hypothetical protein
MGELLTLGFNSQKVRNSIPVLHDLEFARTFVEKEESER